MTCTSCGKACREGARFCSGCGAALVPRCPACGAESEAGARFCDACGAPLAAAAPPEAGARKVVTIIFADLVGSTALHERLDAESARRLMERYYAALRGAVDAHGGTVVKLLGDGVMAAFGVRQVAEDDALRAVRAGVAMQDAFRALVRDQAAVLGAVGLRVAVNTGEVVVSGAHDDLIGDPVNVAARLQEQGRDGDVVVGEATRRLVATRMTLEPLGSLALKGRAESVAAYRVLSLEPPAGTTAAPFVGRADELTRLDAVFAAAVAAPAARLAVLLGSPGLGKSRLIDEFGRRHGAGALLLAAHCDAAGGATFAPLVAALRARLGVEDAADPEALRAAVEHALAGDDADRARIAAGVAALLAGAPPSPEETFFVVRRFLAALAATTPVVLVIDDLHWAEPLLLDLVEHLVQWGAGVPLLVLVGARPELRDLRATLAAPGALVSEVVTLAGLDAGAATRLAANVIGAADLPAAVAARVLATSEGNPLFVGELVRMLVQEGALTREGERWIVGAGLAELEMPPTIHALLAARIERLRPDERQVLERAAVVGRHFSRGAVAALLQTGAADLDARLESLRRSELIERDGSWLLGEPALRFHHVLIRDAAYRRLLKGTRAELHARLADWIEGQVGDAAEQDETIGWHLEQAHQLLAELGPLAADAVALGSRAAARLAAAARRALAGDDVSLAAGLLGRAVARLEGDDPSRADLLLDWCEALLSAGDVGRASSAIEDLGRVAGAERGLGVGGGAAPIPNPLTPNPLPNPRLSAWHTCFSGQLTALIAPQALQATVEAVAAAAEALAKLDDAAGEAKAHSVHAQALARLGRVGACEAALDRALAAARRAGDRRRANAVLAGAPVAALWGPSPVTRASGRCLDVVRVLRITQGAPAVEAVALSCQGVLEALRGRTDAARRMLASSRKMVEDLGIAHRLYETDVFSGRVDLLEGDIDGAERTLRTAYDGLRELGLGIDAARAGALLARALLARDRVDEAEALSHESEALAGDDLQAAIAWRGARAEALARRGEHAGAIELAEAAVAIAAATDALLDHADARLALAAALRAAGRAAEADAEERRGIELWEAKGATLLVGRVRDAERRITAIPAHEAGPGAAPRRVRDNAAAEASARLVAALRAADLEAVERLVAADVQVQHHPTGSAYGRDGMLEAFRGLLGSTGFTIRHEVLATLGESLALSRQLFAIGALEIERFSVDAAELEALYVEEVDAAGHRTRVEIFAPNHLGDAVVRLYARHAELLPDGSARARAATAARSLAAFLGQTDPNRIATALAPVFACVDHRSLGPWTARNAEEFLTHFRVQDEVASSFIGSFDDVLALTADIVLLRVRYLGTARDGGGSFENAVLVLTVFAADGRGARVELWDLDREPDALARVDELTGARAPLPTRCQPRPNAATRQAEREWAAAMARDEAALIAAYPCPVEVLHHPTGATYGTPAVLAMSRAIWRGTNARLAQEILATLGDALALVRRSFAHDGLDAKLGSIGPVEGDFVIVLEVDERAPAIRSEVFPAERLGDAVARLYERHAELTPAGPERRRRAMTARAIAAMQVPPDVESGAAVFAPDIELVDRRSLGTWSAHGAAAVLRHWGSLTAVADDIVLRDRGVLALRPEALLVARTHLGTERLGGGVYERLFLMLLTTASDGRIARIEWFDADRADEALARFEALTAASALPPLRRLRPNAATAMMARMQAAFAARDLATVDALLGEAMENVDHPTEATYGREGQIESSRRMMRTPGLDFRLEALATLGDDLCLFRRLVTASGTAGGAFDVGAYEMEHAGILELDAVGRCRILETFAVDHLGDAIARLYRRHAERLPEGAERRVAAVTANAVAHLLTAWIAPDLSLIFDPAYADVDHRSVGYGALAAEQASNLVASFRELATDLRHRVDDVLALTTQGLVRRTTTTGVWRDGGGTFERTVCALTIFGADGRVTRHEIYEDDHERAALARFDELIASRAPAAAEAWRVRANAATANLARFAAAVAARDGDALADELSETLEVTHHPTGATYDLRALLATWRSILRTDHMIDRSEPLASLGEALTLIRHRLSLAGFAEQHLAAVGEVEIDEIVLWETGADGRSRRMDIFAAERLGAAVARLYQRHAELLPAGPAADRGAAIGRSASRLLAAEADLDAWCAHLSAAVDLADHRHPGSAPIRGDAAARDHLRAQLVDETVAVRVDDVLRLRADAILFRQTTIGTARGGDPEPAVLSLWVWGDDGRLVRLEAFDVAREAEALARFEQLVGGVTASSAAPFANVAARMVERIVRRWAERDWQGLLGDISPAMRMDDRRRLMRLEIAYAEFVTQFRLLFDQPASRWQARLLATRGERLSLHRMSFTAEVAAGGGALAADDHLTLVEVDAAGHWIASVTFDLDDAAAAYAELDARWEAGEAAAHRPTVQFAVGYERCFAARDWAAMTALFAPDLLAESHRLAGWGAVRGPAALVSTMQAQIELAPDTRMRMDHVRACAGGALFAYAWHGTHDGGDFENLYIVVAEGDGLGRARRVDVWEAEQLDQAQARFAELARLRVEAGAAASPFANAASATVRPVIDSLAAHDWPRFEQLFAEEFRLSDRRRVVQLELDRGQYVGFTREVADGRTVRGDSRLIATRGERLALTHSTFEFADADVGPSEIAFLIIQMVDESGRIVRYVRFDVEDVDAAYAELDACWGAGEGAAHPAHVGLLAAFGRAVARREWEPVVARCAPGFIEHDRRGFAVLGTTRGAEAWTQNFRTLTDLAPDTVYRIDHVRSAARGLWSVGTWRGTREGGRYEIPVNAVLELDEHGRLVRADIYEPDQLDQARARFAELAPRPTTPSIAGSPRSGRIAGLANAATRAVDRGTAALAARDWEGFAALMAAGFRHYDRTRVAQIETDGRQWLASFRQMVEMTSSRPDQRVLATRGERLALFRVLWRGAEGDIGPSEIDWLLIVEVDGHGDHLAVVAFDPDDLDAARAELEARWAAGEGAAWDARSGLAAYLASVDRRDWAACAATLGADCRVHDHRLLGWGETLDSDALTRSQQALVQLSSDARYRIDHLRVAPRADLYQGALVGTRDGGAFENPFLCVCERDESGSRRLDLYDLDQLDQALTRFEQVGGNARCESRALFTTPTTATAAMEQSWAAFDAGDAEAARALCAPGFRWEDRRPLFRLAGDIELMIASARERLASGARHQRRAIIGTAGDRVAIASVLWAGGPADGRFEVEFLVVQECDEAGLAVASIFFDPDDARAAQGEAWARWARIEPASAPLTTALGAVLDAANDRDLVRYRACFADDLVIEDHRPGGAGRIEGAAAYLEKVAALWQLAPDARLEAGWLWPVWAPHGAVTVTRRTGSLADEFLWLYTVADARITGVEVFALDDLDAAVARLAALRPDPLRIPPNAAWRVYDRWLSRAEAGDWDGVRALYAPNMVFEDRRRLIRTVGGADMAVAGSRESIGVGAQIGRTLLATAGDRLFLQRTLWTSRRHPGAYEIESLMVYEIDADERVVSVLVFDPGDRATAEAELFERYLRSDAHAIPPAAAAIARGFAARDLVAVRAALPDDFVFDDRRRIGFGRIEGADAYVALLAALLELSPDARIHGLYQVVEAPHGHVAVMRTSGTNHEGGPFESLYVMLLFYPAGRPTLAELHGLEDLERVVTRLAELGSPDAGA